METPIPNNSTSQQGYEPTIDVAWKDYIIWCKQHNYEQISYFSFAYVFEQGYTAGRINQGKHKNFK